MYGDILSDLTAELCGSLGLGGSLNHSADHAMAQAVHGVAPDIAGQGIANPVGEILSVGMLLRWLAQQHDDELLNAVAHQVEKSVEKVLAEGVLTPDLGGEAKTEDMTREIVAHLV
jgi:3-isopropylmalate dehydrogenase